MAIDEAKWHRAHDALSEVVGEEAAETVMSALPRSDVATKADLDALAERLDARFDAVRHELRGEILTLRTEMIERFGEVDQQFGTIDRQFGTIDRQFGTLRVEMTERFGEVDQQFGELRAEMTERFGEVDRHFGTVDRRFGTIDRQFGELRAEIERSTKSMIKWFAGLVFPTLVAGLGASAAITAAIVG